MHPWRLLLPCHPLEVGTGPGGIKEGLKQPMQKGWGGQGKKKQRSVLLRPQLEAYRKSAVISGAVSQQQARWTAEKSGLGPARRVRQRGAAHHLHRKGEAQGLEVLSEDGMEVIGMGHVTMSSEWFQWEQTRG